MPKKKILFLLNTLSFGGAEKQTIELINYLDVYKMDIFLCYLKREEHLKQELCRNQLSGLFCLDKKRKIEFNIFKKLKNIIQMLQPEIVVCINPYSTLYIYIIKLIFKYKFRMIQILHSTVMPNLYNEMITHFFYRRFINRCDDVVFVCKNQMDYWIKNYNIEKSRCKYIHNGINVDYFTYQLTYKEKLRLFKSFDIQQGETVICICATLRPEKKHVDLITAGKILVDRGLPVKILIIGDGSEKRNIERHIKRLRMDDRVISIGFQHDVRPYVALSDVVVICSIAVETFSIAILEAMALGKAIIASDIGGVSEQIIHGENGFLFIPGDVKGLAACVEETITKRLFVPMGEKSRQLVCEKFSKNLMVEAYQNLFLQ